MTGGASEHTGGAGAGWDGGRRRRSSHEEFLLPVKASALLHPNFAWHRDPPPPLSFISPALLPGVPRGAAVPPRRLHRSTSGTRLGPAAACPACSFRRPCPRPLPRGVVPAPCTTPGLSSRPRSTLVAAHAARDVKRCKNLRHSYYGIRPSLCNGPLHAVYAPRRPVKGDA